MDLKQKYEMDRVERGGKITRKIYNVGIRGGRESEYIVREEDKTDKIRTKMGRRVIRYEERLEKGGDNRWARKCWEKGKKRGEENGSVWEEQRKSFYKEKGILIK